MNIERIQYLEGWQLPCFWPETTITISRPIEWWNSSFLSVSTAKHKNQCCAFFFLQGFPMYRKSKHWQRFKLFQHCAKKWKQFSKALHKKKKNYSQLYEQPSDLLGAMPPWVKGRRLRTRQYLIRTCHQTQSCLRYMDPSIWEWQWTEHRTTEDQW